MLTATHRAPIACHVHHREHVEAARPAPSHTPGQSLTAATHSPPGRWQRCPRSPSSSWAKMGKATTNPQVRPPSLPFNPLNHTPALCTPGHPLLEPHDHANSLFLAPQDPTKSRTWPRRGHHPPPPFGSASRTRGRLLHAGGSTESITARLFLCRTPQAASALFRAKHGLAWLRLPGPRYSKQSQAFTLSVEARGSLETALPSLRRPRSRRAPQQTWPASPSAAPQHGEGENNPSCLADIQDDCIAWSSARVEARLAGGASRSKRVTTPGAH